MTNALYGPPQAPVDNALMRDPQSMTLNDMLRAAESMTMRPLAKGERPADPLRWAADYYVGQNKDLPAPQFFMDPRALSVRNMLHSGLGTAANWLDGTKDPSLVGPAEMVSPLGLAGMGMGVANAVTRPGRDFRIADDLARQHPGAAPVASVPYGANLRGASNPTSAAHVYDYGLMPGTPRAPVNTNATPYAVKADNAKGSAPGTVVNSIAEQPQGIRAYHGSPTPRPDGKFDQAKIASGEPGVFFTSSPELASKYAKGGMAPHDVLQGAFDESLKRGYMKSLPNGGSEVVKRAEHDNLVREITGSWLPDGANVTPVNIDPSKLKTIDAPAGYKWEKDYGQLITESSDAAKREGFDGIKFRGMADEKMPGASDVFAVWGRGNVKSATSGDTLYSSPSASAPGLAANSTQQQDDQGVMSILKRYGLAD